ncbi:MAG: DnaA N-terminal domain-containing protein, partial [Pseudomonadota bacterium]
MTNDTWGTIQTTLKANVGANAYVTWIEPLEFDSVANGVATFHVPTTFVGNYVDQNFGDQIVYQMRLKGFEVDRLAFEVPANTPARPTSTETVAMQDDEDGIDLGGAKLDSRFTFDGFIVGKPNELAHAAAKRVASGGDVTFN